MGRLVFLLEERSMQALLEGLLPRFFPCLEFHCVPHSGKTDLDHSIRNVLRSWRTPGDQFVVVRDSDGANCAEIKEQIRDICREESREDTLIRIVCQELEAWYLGDPDALAKAYGNDGLQGVGNSPKYRDPDAIAKPSRVVEQLVGGYRKIPDARRMAQHLSRDGNRSHSFRVFLSGIERLSNL